MATLKYSRQRESIKEFLMTRTDHPTADVVYQHLREVYPNISLEAAEHFQGRILGHVTNFYGICEECLEAETKVPGSH